ncbi:mucin-associated surface protein (MASP), partial [Trypanosoma cruzi]
GVTFEAAAFSAAVFSSPRSAVCVLPAGDIPGAVSHDGLCDFNVDDCCCSFCFVCVDGGGGGGGRDDTSIGGVAVTVVRAGSGTGAARASAVSFFVSNYEWWWSETLSFNVCLRVHTLDAKQP